MQSIIILFEIRGIKHIARKPDPAHELIQFGPQGGDFFIYFGGGEMISIDIEMAKTKLKLCRSGPTFYSIFSLSSLLTVNETNVRQSGSMEHFKSDG